MPTPCNCPIFSSSVSCATSAVARCSASVGTSERTRVEGSLESACAVDPRASVRQRMQAGKARFVRNPRRWNLGLLAFSPRINAERIAVLGTGKPPWRSIATRHDADIGVLGVQVA